jgi:two-component system sensor histidine kinase/response regulator
MKAERNKKAEMERKMLENSELLSYSVRSEEKAREDADLANRSKSTLLSKITHEIRTPMNAMVGMASLLNESPLSPEQRKFTGSILQSGDQLLELINTILMQDILQFSKVDSDKELELKDFDLKNSLEEVLDVFGKKASDAGIDLAYSISDNVPPNLVGDAYRVRQILMNLIENAFRFTTTGDISIRVSAIQSIEDSRLNIQFQVKDTGEGMDEERLKNILKELQSPDVIETKSEHLGLTLIICKKLVSLMGGALNVKSTLGEGTTFSFNILVHASLQTNRSLLYPEMAGAEGKKILVVDDNATVLAVLENQLKKWKVVPYVASSAQQALQILEKNTDIELVITDLLMPYMDGVDLSKAIKQHTPNMPIILLANNGDDYYRRYSQLFVSCLNKPIKQHLLSKQIASGIRHKRSVSSAHKEKRKFSNDFAEQYPMRILVGEDDLLNQQMIKMTLSKLGYEAFICGNGKEVLEEVSHSTYDLILMDVQMPEMDGLEASRMIRLCLTEQPIIVAMTANTMQGDREMCLAAGMDDYISKPVKIEDIADTLEKWSLQVKQYNNN